MTAVRKTGKVNDNTCLIDIGMMGVAGVTNCANQHTEACKLYQNKLDMPGLKNMYYPEFNRFKYFLATCEVIETPPHFRDGVRAVAN